MTRNMCLLKVVISWNLLHAALSGQITNSPEDYCQYETFQPRCLKNEVIRMESATYGRMRVGRCITAAEVDEQKTLSGAVSRLIGCSSDVLPLLDRKCSGKTECDIRVIDMSLENATPCFPGLNVYLELSYDCINVVDEERSCSASASAVPTHIIGFLDGSNRICGTVSQPWIVDAPDGQKIRISLIDFGSSTSGQFLEQRRLPCKSYGVIVDNATKRNQTICGGGARREIELYTSTGNVVDIFLNPSSENVNGDNRGQFLLKIEAIGCSDLVPPEDAWLKRSDDSIVIGCYSSRQTWHLHCEAEKWIGVFGNCSEEHMLVVQSEIIPEGWSDKQVLTVVAVAGLTLTVCLAVLCTGIVCLRRFSSKDKKKQDYNSLMYHMNSAQRQHIDRRMYNEMAIDVTANDAHRTNVQHAPTYSVFVNESGSVTQEMDTPVRFD